MYCRGARSELLQRPPRLPCKCVPKRRAGEAAPVPPLACCLDAPGLTRHLALNHQDVQICVPKPSSAVAAGLLCSTGLFQLFDEADGANINLYTKYKQGFPHLRTTSWVSAELVLIIFPAAFFGLDQIEKVLIQPSAMAKTHISKELSNEGLLQGINRAFWPPVILCCVVRGISTVQS